MSDPSIAAPRILVVEDDSAIADIVATTLRFQGDHVDVVADAPSAITAGLSGDHDLIVLDVMLPGGDGLDVCRQLRNAGVHTPVIFLTALSTPNDRIMGFLTGGDDYLAKPFNVDELALRVRALLRRAGGTSSTSESA
jgi:DNA-binding response OmpR family regulator